MENASRALIMAASTLIALMVLASMIYLFRQGALLNEHYDRNQISRNLELYNSKFLQFNRDDNSFSDIMSVCNLAYDINVGTEYSPTWVVQVEFNIGGKAYTLTSSQERANSTANYKRNCVFEGLGNEVVSLYDLAEKKAGDFGFSFDTLATKENGEDLMNSYPNYKITESRFFKSYKFEKDGSFSSEEIVKQEPVFLFRCIENEIEYNNMGRIKKMKFNCALNEHEIVNY